jgi:hypothetical protein
MPTHGTSLPAHWDYYLDRSLEAQTARYDDLGHGREEQLWETLDVIQKGGPFDDATRERLDRLPWNRAKKHRRLRRRLAANVPPARPGEGPHVEEIAAADTATAVRGSLRPDQWDVEYRLARGETFAEVAPLYGVAPGTLKARVTRWRARLRSSSLAC